MGFCSLFKKSIYFYVTIAGDFERFQHFNFQINFLKNEKKNLQKTGVTFYPWKYYDCK